MKNETLIQIGSAIEIAPVCEPFEYVPEFDRFGEELSSNEIYPVQMEQYVKQVGQVAFSTEKVSFKLLNDKPHLKWFKAQIQKNWKAKNIRPLKMRPLPSKSSCLKRMIQDKLHLKLDPESYYINIYNAWLLQ